MAKRKPKIIVYMKQIASFNREWCYRVPGKMLFGRGGSMAECLRRVGTDFDLTAGGTIIIEPDPYPPKGPTDG